MTVGHGRRLFEQAKAIGEQVEVIRQLLDPTELQSSEPDPIAQITTLLENIAIQNSHQLAEMQIINAKLDAVMSALGIGER
ncbi:hypothetical protein [Bradyrhizobium sp. CCBAU 21360]|uniref:hypothetical protein n=1 Tax=Bradyrhizobium sp. CCBAU 21360 TaxID=1325081 RepID=UPI0023054648|nr:hypothetical protein [Bradyrhizobium sp. CCBAU 21360]MDA9452326.1 hypothetical protein [Bradyrhizobium sp. CCBAU 21360]